VTRVFLAGEGGNELGGWAAEPAWREPPLQPGVVEAMLRSRVATGWEVCGARCWKDAPKLRVGGRRGDAATVRRMTLDALEAGAHALVFVRDEDGDAERTVEIHGAIAEVASDQSFATVGVAGETARPTLEGWLLALTGRRGTEAMSRNKAQAKLGLDKQTLDMVSYVEKHGTSRIAPDAQALRGWLDRAEGLLRGA
jgi:hypothetical protein